jgi:hypothetical protein
MTGSPNNRNTSSAQGTPRTSSTSQQQQQQQQPQWTQGYHTPPRTQSSSSNLYNVMSNEQRGSVATNGSTNGTDGYGSVLPAAGYPSQQSSMMNGGGSSSNKRVREIDDDGSRGSRDVSVSRGPSSPGEGLAAGMKRRKTIRENSLPGVAAAGMASTIYDRGPAGGLNRSRSAIVQRH